MSTHSSQPHKARYRPTNTAAPGSPLTGWYKKQAHSALSGTWNGSLTSPAEKEGPIWKTITNIDWVEISQARGILVWGIPNRGTPRPTIRKDQMSGNSYVGNPHPGNSSAIHKGHIKKNAQYTLNNAYEERKEPGSSVSIMSCYGLDDRAIEVRSPAEARWFFL
jgi:hypothetical protein